MNLPNRSGQGAARPARVRSSRRVVAVVAALVLTGFAAAARAETPTRLHTVAQTQTAPSSPAKSNKPGSKAPAKKPLSKPATSSAKSTTVKSHSAPSQKQVPAPPSKPVEMKRASQAEHGKPNASHATRLLAAHNTSHLMHAPPRVERAAVVRTPLRGVSVRAPKVAAVESQPASPRKVTSDDFLRAAGVARDSGSTDTAHEALTQGVSRPTEMDEDRPLPEASAVVTKAPAHATAPAAQLATNRVDGFGAEGAALPAHRTLAKTLAAHSAELGSSRPVAPSAEEQAVITEEAIKPVVMPALYTPGGRLIMPKPLKGSRDVLVHQNTMADSEGLERIQDDEALDRLRDAHQLVRLPESASLEVNEDLPVERRYARPWTVRFATEIAKAYSAHFGEPIRVNSAVRTVAYQLRLMRVNGNAAAVDGDTASPHLTGQAIDIGKHGMSNAQIAWMRAYLLPLMQVGKIDVEEEFQQACFHISVYRSYLPAAKKPVKAEVAQVHRPAVPTEAEPPADTQ